jgi:hypothetical protein
MHIRAHEGCVHDFSGSEPQIFVLRPKTKVFALELKRWTEHFATSVTHFAIATPALAIATAAFHFPAIHFA